MGWGVASMKRHILAPFKGYFCPGLYFSSNYCLWLSNFSSTPTGIGPYTDVWLITPHGKRVLLVAPETAGAVVCAFHNFHEVIGASFVCEWPDPQSLHVAVEAKDGTSLEIRIGLVSSSRLELYNSLAKITPPGLALIPPFRAILGVKRKLLVGLDGMKTAGKTETGKSYRFSVDRFAFVKSALAKLNGSELGVLIFPRKPVEFGDIRIPTRAFLSFGTLHIEYEPPGQGMTD